MAKQRKVFGVLESDTVLLEPVHEIRYQLDTPLDPALVGRWLTVQGVVEEGGSLRNVQVTRIEKNTGKVTRSGVMVADAPNLPPEANGAGGYLYQPRKGRYLLLSSGPVDGPVQGDFSAYWGRDVKVTGVFGASNYILYSVKVVAK